MKLILKIFLLFLIGFSFALAEEEDPSKILIKVKTTMNIPGAGCEESKTSSGIYECSAEPGFSTVMLTMSNIIKYFTIIATLTGVLFIVINGIGISMSGVESGFKEKAKERMIKTIMGLILLLMSGTILYILAPWVYK